MEAFQALAIQFIVALVMSFLAAALLALRSFLKAKLSTEHFTLLDRIAETAVWAIEQQGPGVFTTKKEAATQIVNAALADKGVTLPDAVIDAAIESNVASSLNYEKLTATPGASS